LKNPEKSIKVSTKIWSNGFQHW